MASIRKPLFSNCSIMSPTAFLATASGLMMVKVRCRVFIVESFVLGRWSLVSGFRRYTHGRDNSLANFSGRFGNSNSCRFHGLDLLGGSSLPAGNDRAGMAHPPSRRRSLTRNESHHRLFHPRLHVFRSSFLGVASDFPDNHYHFGLRILVKQFKRIEEVGPNDGISTDANRRGLPDPPRGELINRFVRQRARARDDPDGTFEMDSRRHDSDFALARRNDTRAVRPDEPRAPILQILPRANHIKRRNALSDADDQLHLSVGGFHNRIGGKWRRHENHRCIRAGLVDRFLHRVEDRPAFVSGAALAGSDPADDL